MYLNTTIADGKLADAQDWRITLDVFKYISFYSISKKCIYWRITLDVFKYIHSYVCTTFYNNWRITLDVFKFFSYCCNYTS